MSAAEAPPRGWYPDPDGGVRLRWWDGTDWTALYRSRPSPGELLLLEGRRQSADRRSALRATTEGVATAGRDMGGLARADAEEIISQVRQVARNEVDRAANVFSQRARTATQELEPLISEYTSRVLRWLKIALVVLVVLVLAWFVFAAIADVTFFNWLGDRIDNLTDD